MKKIFSKFITLSLSAFLLAACQQVSPEQKARVSQSKKIALYTNFSDELSFVEYGLTIFGNDNNSKDISSWQINNVTNTLASQKLKTNPSVEKVGTIDAKQHPINNRDDLNNVLALANQSGYDTVIIIEPSQINSNFRAFKKGHGVFYKNLLDIKQEQKVYSMFSVDVYDTNTKEMLASEINFNSWNGLDGVDVENPIWHQNPIDYTSQEMEFFKNSIINNTNRGLDYALRNLGLIQ